MELSAPLFVSWQLTRDCNLACTHCCTDSAPGKAVKGELNREEALHLARQIVTAEVPYVMLAGGEPLMVPHFLEIAELLGNGGVDLKIETNGQYLTPEIAQRLAQLPIRSIQISLDGDTPETYGRQRVGGKLEKAWAACRMVREAGMPLEITFAPTRDNIAEAEAVARRAVDLGAFRFNTGQLMRLGTASRLWDRLEPTREQYADFREMLDNMSKTLEGKIELCYLPFTIEEGLAESLSAPPATLLVLPHGKIKVTAPLPYTCADVRDQTLAQCWDAYRQAWQTEAFAIAARRVLDAPELLADANKWQPLEVPVLAGR
jgi:MoaA/NifB/PqqE/SkfB family radical SAM enzyme